MKHRTYFINWLAGLALFLTSTAALAEERKGSGAAVPATNSISQAADGTIKLHAKEAVIHGTTVRYEPQPHKNTIGYWTKAEDWVSWDFTLSQPGAFTVEMTQACGQGSGGSEYLLSIAGQAIKDTVPETGAFTNFVHRVIGTVKLPQAGRYTLAVKPVRKPGLAVMDLRAVTLRPVQ